MELFNMEGSDLPVGTDIAPLFREVWTQISGPGAGWSGADRIAIAGAARSARGAGDGGSGLPESVIDLIEVLNRDPSAISESTVNESVADIGLVRYLETVAVVSVVAGIDTFTSLLGLDTEPLPEPVPGEPLPQPRVRNLKMRKAWVPSTGLPLPRLALSAAPGAQKMANLMLDRLYLDPDQSRDVESIRGLTPPQMELLVTAVSHGNKCFYCTLSHLLTLQRTADNQGVAVDPVAIVNTGTDSGIPGGRELIELARSATSLHPDPETTKSVAGVLGPQAAVTAVELAAAFMMINRIVEATGQPVLSKQRERMQPVLERLGAMDFAHSGITTEVERPGALQRVARRLRAGR